MFVFASPRWDAGDRETEKAEQMTTQRRTVRRTASGASKKAAPTTKAAPRKAAPTRSRDDDEDDVEDDEDDEGISAEEAEAIRGGWGAAEQTMDSTSSFAQNFKMTAQTQIVRFLEAQPYASFRRHWVERPGLGTRAYVCPETVGRDCPLCDMGDRVQAVSAFNIAVVADDGTVTHKSWDATPTVTKPLLTLARDNKIGPLSKAGLYFAVSKPEAKRKFDRVNPLITPVRERDLEEDYDTLPPSEAALKKLMKGLYTADILQIPKRKELQEIVDELLDEDDSSSKKRGGSSWDDEDDD